MRAGPTQDYNIEVIEHVTIPNVLLNAPEHLSITPDRCRFYAGDWSHFSQVWRQSWLPIK
jgi:hypothetical protein